MNEDLDIIYETLKKSDNEGTSCPYWLVIDPRQMMKPDCHTVASMIDGPFFSREDAQNYLESRRYAYGPKAVVYCTSGYWSKKYKNMCNSIGQV